MNSSFPLLAQIDSPAALRRLPEASLSAVAAELRGYLIETIGKTGGHFAANLGTVELTIALHYIFETPEDRLVWDVGHQTYPHKILTGRREALSTIRKLHGLAPFPQRAESPFDSFGVGHSSTSISAALGMALGARARGEHRRIAAIIGDGAMTAGMAYEALNHAGHLRADMLVILNDNEMSISPNVGGLSNYLARILSGHFYTSIREEGKKVLRHVPPMWEFARRAEEHVKGMVAPGTLFEEMGFNYIGPVNGHDLPTLIQTLGNLRDRPGPQFLHVVTCKGKGFAPAEQDPIAWHGVTRFDPDTGTLPPGKPDAKPTYSQVFGSWICDAASRDPRVLGITPAMREGSGLVEFEKRFADRYFDVGICEQHAVTLAAGLACEGMHPVVAIYSTFLQRAYDQLIHDVALQNLPVVFAIDRAGPVGQDGATHHGAFDLSFLRCIPNLVVMAPADEAECCAMLNTALSIEGPTAVRYPRGAGIGRPFDTGAAALPVGQGEIRHPGHGLAVLAFGVMVEPAMQAARKFGATGVNMRFIKPLDEALVLELARNHGHLVTVEDNVVAGGAGSAVAECLARHGLSVTITHLGLPDQFLEHGTREELLAACGLDESGLEDTIGALMPLAPRAHQNP
jgi:1-deoxy-D-xylulose-5-phosphate synthase